MFCFKNHLTAAFINKLNNILLGLNFQSLCHHDGLLIELENFSKKPRIIALTESWLKENDTINELTIPKCLPLESKPRTSGQERGGVAFFVKESVTYKLLLFETKVECFIVEVDFGSIQIRYFHVVYRPQRHKLKDFVPQFEEFLTFLRSLKNYTDIFGDFNIDTLVV